MYELFIYCNIYILIYICYIAHMHHYKKYKMCNKIVSVGQGPKWAVKPRRANELALA